MKKGIIITIIVIAVAIALWLIMDNQTTEPVSNTTSTNTTTSNTTVNPTVNEAVNATPFPVEATSSTYETYSPFAGKWGGGWSNTTFGSSGSMTGDLTVNEDGTAQLVLDAGGAVFGLVDPDPSTFSGTYDENALTFTGNGDGVFGDLTMIFSADGTVTASGVAIPATNIDTLSVEGNISGTSFDTNYTLRVGGVVFAEGTLNLTKD